MISRRFEAVARTVFLFTFAILTVFGMTEGRKKVHVYSRNSTPVFFHISYEENSENCGKVDFEVQASPTKATSMPAIGARSAALLSLDTGELLYGKESDVPLPIASTTKIMTALTVLESGVELDSVFTVPREAVGIEGSSIYLYEGEKIFVRDLLYGLLLESGNDAATALAICCSGNVENFVLSMNENAQKMGLSKTRFKNPHGLSADGHVSTAYELGRITFEAMKNAEFRKIVSTKTHSTTPVSSEFPVHFFSNHNRLLRSLDGANGVKTGYTILAGRCLVSSSERDGSGFIAVTLNDRTDWKDHSAMHEYGYKNYKTVRLFEKGEIKFRLTGQELTNVRDGVLVVESSETKLSCELKMENREF